MSEFSGDTAVPDLGQILERIDRLEVSIGDRFDQIESSLAGPTAPADAESVPPSPAQAPPTVQAPAPTTPMMQPPPPTAASGWTAPAAIFSPAPPSEPQRPAPSQQAPAWLTDRAPRPPSPAKPAFEFTSEKILRWVGIALVTLAGVFFVSTAINRGWVSPEAQLAAATLGGFALFAVAVRFGDRLRQWTLPFALAGSTVIAACAVAASAWLDLISPEGALAASVLAAAISVGFALKLRMELVAVTAGSLALVAPIVGDLVIDSSQTALAIWIVAIQLGATGLGLWRRWPLLRLSVGWLAAATFAGYAAYSLETTSVPIGSTTAYAVLGVLTAVLWFGPIIARALPNSADVENEFYRTDQLNPLDHRLVATVPAGFWLTLQALTDQPSNDTRGLTGLLIAAGFAVIADHLYVGKSKLMYLSQLLGCSAVASVALGFLLDGPTLMVALTAQAIVSAVIGHKFQDWPMRILAAVVGCAAAALAIFGIINNLAESSAPAGDALAQLFVLSTVAAISVALFLRRRPEAESVFPAVWIVAMAWTASVALPLGQGQALLSLIWAMAAVAAVVAGIRFDERSIRNVGYATLAVVVAKLLSVDLAEVDVLWRVGLFLIVGLGFLRFAFVLPSLMQRWAINPSEPAVAEAPHEPVG